MAAKLAARRAGETGTKCCCEPAIITECRARSAWAQLCGWPEYVDSAPPKRYANRQLSGELRRNSYSAVPCTGTLLNCEIYTFSGVAKKLPGTTCAVTQYAAFRISYCSGGGFDYAVDEATVSGSTAALTATTRTLTWPTTCDGTVVGYPVGGSIVSTLTDEDTETEAEARVPEVWGAWTNSGTCPACCTSSRTVRGSTDITWSFTASQFRLGIEEGTVGELYTVAVDYIRHPIAGGAWVTVATDYFSVVSTTPGASHDGWPAYDVPQLAGYVTTIANIIIYVP